MFSPFPWIRRVKPPWRVTSMGKRGIQPRLDLCDFFGALKKFEFDIKFGSPFPFWQTLFEVRFTLVKFQLPLAADQGRVRQTLPS